MVRAGWRLPRLSRKCFSRKRPAWSRTQTRTRSRPSRACWADPGPLAGLGGLLPLPAPTWCGGPPRPHLLGCSEERREEAELRRDLRPGVAGVGALAGAGCRAGAAAAGGETVLPGLELVCPASSRPPADFRLDFLHIGVFLFWLDGIPHYEK